MTAHCRCWNDLRTLTFRKWWTLRAVPLHQVVKHYMIDIKCDNVSFVDADTPATAPVHHQTSLLVVRP